MAARKRRFWIAIASAEHAHKGAGGFMQVNHGKRAPLARIGAGDGIVYYSPTETFRGRDNLKSFVLIGTVADDEIAQADMGNGFRPFRRAVRYVPAREAPIRPLLDTLDLTRGKRNWGAPFRFGLVEIGAADFASIAAAMGADTAALGLG